MGYGARGWSEGLNVFYIHSNVIKSTNRGYLGSTSLSLAPGESKTYAFKFYKVADEQAVKDRLYSEGHVDVTVVPGMIFPTNLKAKFDLHTSKSITSVTAQYPSETTISYLETAPTNHKIYELTLGRLGHNNITVNYGNGEKPFSSSMPSSQSKLHFSVTLPSWSTAPNGTFRAT